MFWARPEALSAATASFEPARIPAEPLPRDATYLHALERLLPLQLKEAGWQCWVHANGDSALPAGPRCSPLVRVRDLAAWKQDLARAMAAEALLKPTRLQFPELERPLCSVIIPVYSDLEVTLACLASLACLKAEAPFEVIVVDDASPEQLHRYLEQVPGLRLLHNADNLGFVGSCNAGAALARGQTLVFLNNDTVVLDHWLRALLDAINDDAIGVVGSMLLNADGTLQESGGCIWPDGRGLNYGRDEDPEDPRFCFRRDVDYVSGASLAIKRQLFEQLGGFDPMFAPGYYEDTDLCFRVRRKGLRVVVEPASKLVHLEGHSSAAETHGGMKRHQEPNRQRFLQRWHADLAQQDTPEQIRLYANRSKRKRALLLDGHLPTPDQDSGSNDVINCITALTELGYEVTFLPTVEVGWRPRYLEPLQALGARVVPQHYAGECAETIQRLAGEFDLGLLFRYITFNSYAPLCRSSNPGMPLLLDTVDLHHLRLQREGELAGISGAMQAAEVVQRDELAAIRSADRVFVRSTHELELLTQEHGLPASQLQLLPICRPVARAIRLPEHRRDILFVGGFQHAPNVDAVRYLTEEIMPLVWEQQPSIRLKIAGSHPEQLAQAGLNLQARAIDLLGHVDDLEGLMKSCRLSVAPLRFGAGTKGKVISSFCEGLPCLCSPVAAEGLQGLDDLEHALVRDNSQTFAKACLELSANDQRWKELSTACFSYALRQASLNVFINCISMPS